MGFAQDCLLLERSNSIIEYLSKSYLKGGKTGQAKPVIGKEATMAHISQDRGFLDDIPGLPWFNMNSQWSCFYLDP